MWRKIVYQKLGERFPFHTLAQNMWTFFKKGLENHLIDDYKEILLNTLAIKH